MDNQKIGAFLQDLRKENNMTQLELATKLNFTHQTISKWEKGDSIPDLDSLSVLAKIYNISIEEILEGEKREVVLEKNNDSLIQKLKLFEFFNVFLLVLTFLSLSVNYFTETVDTSNVIEEIFPGAGSFNPFNINEINVPVKGFDLIFNATDFTLFTLGGWLIFIAILSLLIVVIISVYQLIKNNTYTVITTFNTLVIRIITISGLFIGYLLLMVGVLLNDAISINTGYYLGVILSILLVLLNVLEIKITTSKKG